MDHDKCGQFTIFMYHINENNIVIVIGDEKEEDSHLFSGDVIRKAIRNSHCASILCAKSRTIIENSPDRACI